MSKIAHRVFVSYHHANDQNKVNYLRKTYGKNNTIVDGSLEEAYEGMNDDQILYAIRTEHLKSSTVIGSETYKRKWIDWEINASLRPYGDIKRNGLLGIYLSDVIDTPARLQDNIDTGYAVTMKWENISWQLESKIQEAFDNKDKDELVDNTRLKHQRNS